MNVVAPPSMLSLDGFGDALQICSATTTFAGVATTHVCRTFDLPPANRASRSLVKFVFGEEDEHEEALYGTANHRVSEGSRGR
ncbi:hypothetical protein, partial [Burkholderia multivorans]|uniref:hypothetical protein n=1 Tax=Burkholderia multivorans TaxID=87883 RepID=UPI001C254152